MAQIYRRASRTVVCLGESSIHTDVAFDVLQPSCELYNQLKDGSWDASKVMSRYWAQVGPCLDAEILNINLGDPLGNMVVQEWFTCIW
jgi:hypothetical protein